MRIFFLRPTWYYQYRMESFDIPKYRTFDILYRTCFASIPWHLGTGSIYADTERNVPTYIWDIQIVCIDVIFCFVNIIYINIVYGIDMHHRHTDIHITYHISYTS